MALTDLIPGVAQAKMIIGGLLILGLVIGAGTVYYKWTSMKAEIVTLTNKNVAFGTERESIGIAFCERLFGGRWVQTSYSGNFRKKYAGIGDTYDPVSNGFKPKRPGQDYIWNEETWTWDDPNAPEEPYEQP